MSLFISASANYVGEQSVDLVMRPLFAGEDIKNFGFRIILTKERKIDLTMWDGLRKKLRAYVSGFQGGTGSKRIGKQLFLEEFKIETNYDKHTYFDTVYDLITNGNGISQNDITGTIVQQAELQLFGETLQHDVFMNMFTSDLLKQTFDGTNYDWRTSNATFNASTGAITAGGKDVRNNTIDGIWVGVLNNIANEPDTDGNRINRVTMANGAVIQVSTVDYASLTAGSTGLDVNNRTFAVAFTTNISTTLDLFVSTHAATMAAMSPGITVVKSTEKLQFTSLLAGAPMLFDSVTGTNANGTIADTTANTLASTSLSTDEAMTAMKNMKKEATLELKKALRAGKGVYLVTQSFWDNYEETLSSSNPDALESMRDATQDGMLNLRFGSIPLRVTEIDAFLADDSANEYPHRALLTIPDNIVLVLNGSIGETRIWFNVDENENRQRSQFEMNVDFVEPRLITAAY